MLAVVISRSDKVVGRNIDVWMPLDYRRLFVAPVQLRAKITLTPYAVVVKHTTIGYS